MSWNKAFDHAADYWQDIVPEISSICIKTLETREYPINLTLNSDDMFPEPRSLDSSELSPSNEDLTTNIWTTDEDTTLVEEAEKNKFEWEVIAKSFPNLSAKQAKNRWKKIKRQKVKNELNDEQDKLILSLYKTYGGNWKKISAFFDGISPNVIKNRYYTVLKPKVEEDGEENKEIKGENDLIESAVNEDCGSKGKGKGLGTDAGQELKDLNGSGKVGETQGPVCIGAGIRVVGIDGLSESEKRKRLLGLYQKAMEIENYIKKTKSQIHNLVTKGINK